MKKIVVIGCINADLVVNTEMFPKIGETVTGTDFKVVPGGKGANQAVAAARMGASVSMIGCVGNDENGSVMLKNLLNNNIDVSGVKITNVAPTGIASIIVVDSNNSIIVVKGANDCIEERFIDSEKKK